MKRHLYYFTKSLHAMIVLNYRPIYYIMMLCRLSISMRNLSGVISTDRLVRIVSEHWLFQQQTTRTTTVEWP